MSGDFDRTTDNEITMSAGAAGPLGTGAFTIVVLFKIAFGSGNGGLVSLRSSAGGSEVRGILVDSNKLFGFNDFSSGFGSVPSNIWMFGAIGKPAGSNHLRSHTWPYSADGSGTMQHGEAPGAGNHGDPGAVGEIRIGKCANRGNGPIAVVGLYPSFLSDADLENLKTNQLSDYAALGPAELISLESWDGENGCTSVTGIGPPVNRAVKTGEIGAVLAGENPPDFDFSLSSPVPTGSQLMFY